MRLAFNPEIYKMAAADGAILDNVRGIPFGDAIGTSAVERAALGLMNPVSKILPEVVRGSMWAYSNVDDFTRVIEYGSTLEQLTQAWKKFGDKAATNAESMIDSPYANLTKDLRGNWVRARVPGVTALSSKVSAEESFLAESGLRQMTREEQKMFYSELKLNGRNKAMRWLAAHNAQTRLFRYGAANQVGMMRGTLGRLYGQFGIWPQWYLMFLIEGVSKGTLYDRMRFATRLGSVYAGLYYGFKALDVDPGRWLAYPASMGVPSMGPIAGATWEAFKYLVEVPAALRQGSNYFDQILKNPASALPGKPVKPGEVTTSQQQISLSRIRRSWGLFVPNYALVTRDILPVYQEYQQTGQIDPMEAVRRMMSLPKARQ
jgi:hypothetical protein